MYAKLKSNVTSLLLKMFMWQKQLWVRQGRTYGRGLNVKNKCAHLGSPGILIPLHKRSDILTNQL